MGAAEEEGDAGLELPREAAARGGGRGRGRVTAVVAAAVVAAAVVAPAEPGRDALSASASAAAAADAAATLLLLLLLASLINRSSEQRPSHGVGERPGPRASSQAGEPEDGRAVAAAQRREEGVEDDLGAVPRVPDGFAFFLLC